MLSRVPPLLLGCLLFFAPAATAQPVDVSDDLSVPDLNRNPRAETIADLGRLIDSWHNATLKGNSKVIRNHRQQIISFLHHDIEASRWRYNACRKRAEAVLENDMSDAATLSVADRRLLKQLAQAEQWLKVKNRLLRGFEKNDSFAGRYRQITDYLDILRMEYDEWHIRMAERDSPDDTDDK